MGRARHGEWLLNKAAVLVALFAVCLRECSYGTYNQKSLCGASLVTSYRINHATHWENYIYYLRF